jgi:cobalt-zinc-cadmium efflux system outer membrane protein
MWALAVAGAIFTSACATRERQAEAVNQLLASRGTIAATWAEPPGNSRRAASAGEVLSLRRSVELAFSHSPVIREQYAELGMGAAEVLEAGQVPDLGLEYSRLSFDDGHAQITRGVTLALADLLLMPGRLRIANAGQQVTRDRVAARLSQLEAEVETAWFEYTSALQAAQIQAHAARTARASAEYARRLHAAGNLPARALAQELAAAGSADIAAARAHAHAQEARAGFATLVGLSTRADWRLEPRLPALPHHDETQQDLVRRALDSRPEVTAARREAALLEQAWRTTRFWRWLGDFDVGYERERDHDSVLRGPTFRLGLPLLSWNRAGVLRARSSMESARARLAMLELETENEVSLALDRLDTARKVAEAYRVTLVPERENVTTRTIEEVNYMLAGAFEALAARREQFEAYGEYVDAVRDYWLVRIDLRRLSGGALPALEQTPTLEFGAPLGSPMPAQDHGDHK